MYCPHTNKYQLTEWCSKYFNETPSRFKKMKIDQLYAIWYSELKKNKAKQVSNV